MINLSNIVTGFPGRIGRKQFSIKVLLTLFLLFVVWFADQVLIQLIIEYQDTNQIGTLVTLSSVIVMIIGIGLFSAYISLVTQRFHDLNKSGYYTLLVFIPLVNFVTLFYLMITKGTDGRNAYG